MAAVTGTVTEVAPNAGAKMLIVTATTDDGDTIAITLADYGITTFQAILGQTHSTTDSIVITEAPTTAVSDGVLTITVGGSTDDKKRVFIVWGE
jgi:hypothetical protein